LMIFVLMAFNWVSAQSTISDNEVPPSVREKLKDSVKEILETFTSCITIIANKSEDADVRNDYISLANSLFIPGSIMETASCKTKIKRREDIQEYLVRLRDLKYNIVRVYYPDVAYINWEEMTHVGKGVYRGTAYVYQIFEGRISASEGAIGTYQDGTVKTITIEIKKISGIRSGEVAWSVKLGDVLVKELDCD
jgi:hypothetical protein